MELIELTTVEEMLTTYEVLTELYPSLEMEAYRNELTFMVQHNYLEEFEGSSRFSKVTKSVFSFASESERIFFNSSLLQSK